MIYKNIKNEFEYILWLRGRIKALRFGISHRVKTDSTDDFELLTRKLKSYNAEFNSVIDELTSLLRNGDLSAQTDNIGQESGALRIRSSCSERQEKETRENSQTAHQGGSDGGSEAERENRFPDGSDARLLFAAHQSKNSAPHRFQPRLEGLYNPDFRR